MPDRPVASLAAELQDRGHRPRIFDYGTPAALECMAAGMSLTALIAEDLLQEPTPEFVVFRIESEGQHRAVDTIIRQCQRLDWQPTAIAWLPGAGPSRREHGKNGVLRCSGTTPRQLGHALSALCTGEKIQPPATPRGDVSRRGVRPCYSLPVYPAVYGDEKFRIFSLAEEPSKVHNTVGCTTFPVAGVVDLIREMRHVLNSAGAAAFQLRCSEKQDTSRIALAIRANGLSVNYACAGGVDRFTPQSVADLSETGCQAISVDVKSGSQYMLDEHFRAPWTVTEAESVLRAGTFQDVYTVAEVSAPVERDDHQTFAETERLIRRTRPDSVAVTGSTASRTVERKAERIRHALDPSAEVSSTMALMARLAGQGGNEAAFGRLVNHQLRSLDVDGLRSTIERVNRGAAESSRAPESLSEQLLFRDAIGN